MINQEILAELKAFNERLNEQPDPKLLKEHEGFKYVPIEIVEDKLQEFFNGLVQYKIMSYTPFQNEFILHARIGVYHPVMGEWMYYDGIGAGMFEQKPGTSVKDFVVHKKANGARMTVPLAYAEAIKVAAKKIGKIFGADINRGLEDNLPKQEKGKKPEKPTQAQMKSETITDLILHSTTILELEKVEQHLLEEHVDVFLKRKEELLNPKKVKITKGRTIKIKK